VASKSRKKIFLAFTTLAGRLLASAAPDCGNFLPKAAMVGHRVPGLDLASVLSLLSRDLRPLLEGRLPSELTPAGTISPQSAPRSGVLRRGNLLLGPMSGRGGLLSYERHSGRAGHRQFVMTRLPRGVGEV
jgi:hypothetical protein